MEALENAITLWEEALSAYSSASKGNALPSREVARFTSNLQRVIEEGYNLQEQCELMFLHEVIRI